jgi:hypothetical protein
METKKVTSLLLPSKADSEKVLMQYPTHAVSAAGREERRLSPLGESIHCFE